MLSKSNIVLVGALVLTAAHDIKLSIDAHRAAKLYLASAKEFQTELEVQAAQMGFLLALLDKHGVPITEFDMIALNFNN